MNPLNHTTEDALWNHRMDDPVRLVPEDCEKCGPYKPMRIWKGIEQCGACGWVQEPER